MERENRLPQVAAIIVLLLLVLLLVLGLRLGVRAEEVGTERDDKEATPVAGTAVPSSDSGSVALDTEREAVPVLHDNSLSPAPVPQTFEGKRPHHEFQTYTVER
ncbi:MAG: hypothetical protein ACK2UT_22060, partial [Candidatus Promineifilaceae bacterium]